MDNYLDGLIFLSNIIIIITWWRLQAGGHLQHWQV